MIAVIALCLSVGFPSISVNGSGFMRLMEGGKVVYARKGSIASVHGELGIGDAKFLPDIFVPQSASSIHLEPDGTVTAETPAGSAVIGRIVIGVFPRGQAMNVIGDFFTCADRPTLAYPGSLGAGLIQVEGTFSPAKASVKTAPPVTIPKVKTNPEPSSGKADPTVKIQAAEAPPVQPKSVSKPIQNSQPVPKAKPGQLEIVVHPSSKVENRSFTLGDIADLSGPADLVSQAKSIWCGYTPPIGFTRKLDYQTVRLRLLGAHLDPSKCVIAVPDGATVGLECQTIGSDELTAKALDAISSLVGSKTTYAATNSVAPLSVPNGTLDLDVSSPRSAGNGGWFVNITAKVGGQIVGTRQITLAPMAGSIFVSPGDTVTVIVKAGTAEVTVPGQVVSKAFLGQPVQVRVTHVGSRTTVQSGILVSASQVEVKL